MIGPPTELLRKYGPWAVVTGASDGIGAAFAEALAAAGLNVVLVARRGARGTLRALGRRPTVRPGALSKLLGWSLSLLPRRARVVVIGQVMKGMT